MYLIQNKGEEMAGKILKLCFIFLFIVLWSTAGWAVKDRPQYYGDQASLEFLQKFTVSEKEDLGAWVTGVFQSPYARPSPTTSPHFDTVGNSYYDYDANYRLQRTINRSSLGYIHTVYTNSEDGTQVPRNVFYTAWLNTGVQSATDAQVSDVADGEEGRGGFGAVTSLADGRAVVIYHRSFGHINQLLWPPRGTYIAIESAPGAGTFGGNEFQAPDSIGSPPKFRDSGIWPDGAAQKYKDTNFVHVVYNEGNYGLNHYRYMAYVRAKIDPGIDPNFFVWGTPHIFDTSRVFIDATVVASQQSAKVALIFAHPRKGFPSNANVAHPDSLFSDADLYYIESTTGGDDWQNGFNNDANDGFQNITNYVDSDQNRVWGDFSAAYDEQDSLVIAFSAPLFLPGQGASGTQGSIFFWRRGIGGGGSDLREVYNYSISGDDAGRLQHTLPVINPHIGVYKGTAPDSIGDYYIIWSMGTGDDTTENDPPPLEGFWNNDIYCSASTNNGFSWSSITNLTNSQTPACTVGACDNDIFASLARDINDTLHIRFIDDRVPAAAAQGTVNDTSRNNYIFYYKVKAKSVQKDTLAALTPNTLTGFKFDDGATNDTFVFLANVGNQSLTVNSIVADHPAASVTVTGGTPPYGAPPFTIPEGGAPAKVFLNFNGAAANTPCSSYTVRWTFNTNAKNSNLGLSPGTFQAKAQFALQSASEPFVPIRFLSQLGQILETDNGMRMNISNVSALIGAQSNRTGMNLPQGDSGIHFLSQGTGLFGAMLSTGDTLVARYLQDETEYRALAIPGALTETIQVKDTVYVGDVPYDNAINQGRPGKGGDWKIVRYNYAVDLFNDPQNFPDYDSIPPWPGHWFGYWFSDEFWFKNGSTYNWTVWYRKKVKKAAPCWWPEWPGAPTMTSQIYDGIVMDWDPQSDSADLSTGASLPINSTAYNDTFKFVYARGRGTPYDKRWAAQVFLVDTSMHFKGDTVCVGTNCNVDPCSLSMVAPRYRMYGAKSISYEKYVSPYNGYRTKEMWELLTTPGYKSDFLQNKEDLTIVTTHACSDPTEDTVAYAVGLAVSLGGQVIDSLKKAVNEMRLCMSLDTIKLAVCTYRPADVDGNGSWTLTDIVGLVNMVFKGTQKPTPLCRTDCNASGGNPNLTDIVCLVNKVFKGAANPPIVGECCKLTAL